MGVLIVGLSLAYLLNAYSTDLWGIFYTPLTELHPALSTVTYTRSLPTAHYDKNSPRRTRTLDSAYKH